jgi:hypothetical protein
LRQVRLRNAIDAGITYSMAFAQWEAAVAAGATMDELYRMERGEYPKWFVAKVMAWHNVHSLVEAHKEDASAIEAQKRARKRRS